MDALPLNLRLRKGGIPYPRLKMNINSSDLCSRVTRYWALSNRISDMGWCTFNYQTRIWDSYPWGCYFSNIPTWQMSPSFRFEMVDLFYDGAAHSSSYPPTHWIMASFPFSRVIISSSSWDATGNYFQLPLPAVAQGSSDMKFSFSKILNSPVCACWNKLKYQRTNTLIIHHFEDDVK